MSRFVREGQPPKPTTDTRSLRRVVAGATVGTALEWYDFFIFGTAAAWSSATCSSIPRRARAR